MPGGAYSAVAAPPPPSKRRREHTSCCCRRRYWRRSRVLPDDRRTHSSRGETPSPLDQEGPTGAKEAAMKSSPPATRRPRATRPDAVDLTGPPKLLARDLEKQLDLHRTSIRPIPRSATPPERSPEAGNHTDRRRKPESPLSRPLCTVDGERADRNNSGNQSKFIE